MDTEAPRLFWERYLRKLRGGERGTSSDLVDDSGVTWNFSMINTPTTVDAVVVTDRGVRQGVTRVVRSSPESVGLPRSVFSWMSTSGRV